MPYTAKTLPDFVKEYPAKAQKIWLGAFNSAYANCKKSGLSKGNKSCDEQASKIANSAVTKYGKRE